MNRISRVGVGGGEEEEGRRTRELQNWKIDLSQFASTVNWMTYNVCDSGFCLNAKKISK